jgi:hypothetical protein
MLIKVSYVAALFLLFGSNTYGDVGVVLDESLNTGLARIIATGHSAIYLSRICPESPVKLRLCRVGEHGSILSSYSNLGEDWPFEWNAVPLYVYLYGVESTDSRPIFSSKKIKRVLEERYREKYLSPYCASEFCTTNRKADWRQMVGATLSRSIYIFVVETTLQQDVYFIGQFNSASNRNHFNYITRNCANFTMNVINSYFPHAVHANHINDFGMASPKAIARSFTLYALKRSDLRFGVLHFGQLPGTIKRSSETREGTEQFYQFKKLVAPMLLFGATSLPYLLTGRFNPEKMLEQHARSWLGDAEYQNSQMETNWDYSDAKPPTGQNHDDLAGSPEAWKQYRQSFNAIAEQAVRNGVIPDRGYLSSLLTRLEQAGLPYLDADGNLWMIVSLQGTTIKIGLSKCNILAPNSDASLAYDLVLAGNRSILKSPTHNREPMAEFQEDWDLMQDARVENGTQDSDWVSAVAP